MKLLGRSTSSIGRVTIEDEPLGKGGEGSVYTVSNHQMEELPPAQQLVAKIYHNPTEGERYRKVLAMLSTPPSSPSVVWPLALLYSEDKKFMGYLMRKLDQKSFRSWADLSNTSVRRKVSPKFDFKYALMSCRNLAANLHNIHGAGHAVGDINESNLFVNQVSEVFIIDTDSSQIRSSEGEIYKCTVGKPEFTAPELMVGKFEDHQRTPSTDTFAFTIASFNMLTGGAHPSNGIWKGSGEPPSISRKIKDGLYPSLTGKPTGQLLPAPRIPAQAIPLSLRRFMIKSLSNDPTQRPPLEEVIRIIDTILPALTKCSQVEGHWFEGSVCLLCQHAKDNQPDPWAPQQAPQPKAIRATTLPAVGFNEQAAALPPRGPVLSPTSGAMPSQSGSPSAPPRGRVHSPQSPQQTAGSSTGQSNRAPQQETPLPRKYKGKTILNYADGTRRVRPPLLELAKQDSKLAWKLFLDELPDWLKPYWPASRSLAEPVGIGLGLAFSLIFSFALFFILRNKIVLSQFELVGNRRLIVASVLSLLTIIAPIGLAASAFLDRRNAARQYGTLKNLKKDSRINTFGRTAIISITWGPLIIVSIVGVILYELTGLISKLEKSW
jgi:serine/threonine protein kinase